MRARVHNRYANLPTYRARVQFHVRDVHASKQRARARAYIYPANWFAHPGFKPPDKREESCAPGLLLPSRERDDSRNWKAVLQPTVHSEN